MKKIALILLSTSCFFSLPTYGQFSAGKGDGVDKSTDETAQLLTNLSTYFGYNITSPAKPFASVLLDYTLKVAGTGNQILNVFFGARPVNPLFLEFFSTNATYDTFDSQANVLFKDTFATAASEDGTSTAVSVVKGFDQPDYKLDPTSQAIKNLLIAPDSTVCADDDSSCTSQNKTMYTALKDVVATDTGYLPAETTYFTNDVVSKYVDQLNANSLVSPLIYDESTAQTSAKGALPASTQEQFAMNYVRYATNAVVPLDPMIYDNYKSMWTNAHTDTKGLTGDSLKTVTTARHDLMTYLLKTRVYAAQSSLPISNFYQSMAQRMPQTVTKKDSSTSASTSTKTSEAFNQFIMATWRLYSPDTATGSQWVDKINTASAATTQKEIAILLSEINYQLYLGRQTQERILLTNSLLALQSLAMNQPNNVTTSVSVSSSGGTTE